MALSTSSAKAVVDYTLYGSFENLGQHDYEYVIKDKAGLAAAVGAGIYPHEGDLTRDAEFSKLIRAGKLGGPLEDYRPEVDAKLAYYKWVSQKGAQNPGLRLYNIARSLEEMGRTQEALKAYHAILVHFPKSVSFQNNSPWYVAVSALDDIWRLLDANPALNLSLEGARVDISNRFDQKVTNDAFAIDPGRWVPRTEAAARPTPERSRTVFQRGGVKFVRWTNGDWQLFVNDKPFLIRGVSYFPTPVGSSPDYGYKAHDAWMTADDNKNGRIDAPYESFVDSNGNNRKDDKEAAVGDFRLLQNLGANTIRLYHRATNQALLRDLNENFGIRVLMGDLIGAYTVGSGAEWEAGTDYSNQEQRERMRQGVRQMVETHKNEDYVLMWVLGNENNFGHGSNARKDPRTYYKFVNSLARMIHVLDPSRPVAICNGDLEFLDMIARECPDVDVIAVNAYRGGNGMGESFWTSLREVWRKPVLISEFGAPAYNAEQKTAEAEKTQADYLVANWNDIEAHAAGSKTGNSIGGVVFEWVDEWWKAGTQYEASVHDKSPQSKGAFHGGWMYEEWLGLTSQGDGEKSPFLRRLRPAYTALKDGPWREIMNFGSAVDDEARAGRSGVRDEN